MKLLLVSEQLGGRADEGIKNLTLSLLRVLSRHHEARALTGAFSGAIAPGVTALPMNRFFLNARLLITARDFRPDAVLYVPWTSGTPRTFWRGRVLRWATGSPVVLLLTQPYRPSSWESVLIRALLPDLTLAQSEATIDRLGRLGARIDFLPGGVDLERFRIPDPAHRAERRRALMVGETEQLVLHVGHLNALRMNVGDIVRLAARPGRRLVIVGSTHTPQDPMVVSALQAANCVVVRDFVPRIEEYYWAADAYLFPTRNDRSSIAVPLSVLEALACGVPVVTTRFGALPRLLPAGRAVRFAEDPVDFERALESLPVAPDPEARRVVADFGWDALAAQIGTALSRLGPPGGGRR